MVARDRDAVQAILMRTVEGYRPDGDGVPGEAAGSRSAWGAASRTLH
jgi:hypothetical protein